MSSSLTRLRTSMHFRKLRLQNTRIKKETSERRPLRSEVLLSWRFTAAIAII